MNSSYARLDALAVQQDYLWFLTALGWLAVAGLGLRQMRPDRAPCAPWVWTLAGSGILLAALEIALQSAPRADPHAPRVEWDVMLAAGSALSAGGFLWSAFARVKSREWRAGLRGAGIVALGGVLAARWQSPTSAACALVLIQAGGIAGIIGVGRRATDRPALTGAMGIYLVLLPLLAAHGPLAELTLQAVRWTELTYFGTLAALSQMVGACWIGRRIWLSRPEAEAATASSSAQREVKWIAALLMLWLIGGLGLASWSGAGAGANYEKALKLRARTAAAMLNPDELASCAGPLLKVESVLVVKQEEGWDHLIGVAPHLRSPAFFGPQKLLSRIEKSNPDARFIHIATLRHGYLTSFVFPSEAPGAGDKVSLLAPASESDLRWWGEKSEAFEGPIRTTLGPLIRVREPLVTTKGQMLGWLLLDFGVPDWVASRAQARRQMFAVVGLGTALALLAMLHRLREAEREDAIRAAAAAASADRLKTEFLAKVSHELRTPIQSVLGYGELLSTLPLEAEPRRWLNALRNHGDIMVRLVNDLLDLSTLQTGTFRFAHAAVDLSALAHDIVADFRHLASAKGLDLECQVGAMPAHWVVTDPARLRQVLVNLLGNAVKYTPQGRVVLRLQLETTDAPRRGLARIAVCDTGPGIAAKDQAKIFEEFMRLDSVGSHEGAGIGLALAKALTRGLGGELRVESDGKSGSAFYVELPVELTDPPWRKLDTTQTLAGLRVLVADDNSLVRELYLVHLQRCGAQCETVADGAAAIERGLREPFDAIIVDLQMPLADGFTVARKLRQGAAKSARRLRIIGVSARNSLDHQQALDAGMDRFLTKPVALKDLSDAVAGETEASERSVAAISELDVALRRRLLEQFRQELPKLITDISASLRAGEWPTVRARVHYLKNGADILRLTSTREACLALDAVAAREARSAAANPFAELKRALQREAAIAPLSPDFPVDQTNN